MSDTIKKLKEDADNAKARYAMGYIDKSEVLIHIEPYVKAFNEKAKEIAVKYNQKPKTITTLKYLKSR